MGVPWCCQPGGNTVYSLSQHFVSPLMSVVKAWKPDLKNGTLTLSGLGRVLARQASAGGHSAPVQSAEV